MKKIIVFLSLISISFFVIAWCSSKTGVKPWDTVSITYIATFSNGQVFDQNNDQSPLNFTVGSGQVIKWLDEGVVGIDVGKTKTITIKPEKWYGDIYDENKIQKISQLIFDKLNIKIEKGTIQTLGDIEWVIKWSEKDTEGNVLVLFDINPRRTRDTLTYKITVLSKK